MYDRIFIAVDDSEPGNRALDYGLGLAKALTAELCLMHAGEVSNAMAAEQPEHGRNLISEAHARARAAEIKPHCVLVTMEGGSVVEQIVGEAEQWDASMIVMGTHADRGLVDRFSEPVTDATVAGTEIPVLLVQRPNAEFASTA